MNKVFFLIFLLSCLSLKGQESNQLNTFIISSLDSYIGWKKNIIKKMGGEYPEHFFLCKDGLPLSFSYNNLPNIIYGSLENIEGLPRLYKKRINKGGGFIFVRINLVNDSLNIIISNSIVKRTKKRMLNISLVDWGQYTYKYSFENKKWELYKETYGGI